MSTAAPSSPGRDPGLGAGIASRIGTVVAFLVLNGALLFLSAGRTDWPWAWVFLGICTVSMIVNGTILLATNPETVAERGRPGDTPIWDRAVAGVWALMLFLVVPVVAGLDVRLAWTGTIAPGWNVLGALLLATGLGLAGWATVVNAFFSTAVRIQEERGHTVCRGGPYRAIRHPGYLGFVLQSVGTPLVLGSVPAVVPGLIAAGLMVVRTGLEDRLLLRELAGYPEFARDVRFRLIPGIW